MTQLAQPGKILPIIFRFDLIPPSLNGAGSLSRMHWTVKREVQQAWDFHVREAMDNRLLAAEFRPIAACDVIWVVRSSRYWDYDNMVAAFKMLGDALVHNKILADDSPRVVRKFSPLFEKVSRKERGCRVEIYPLA